MRPTSSRSLCFPPARAHFCELTARWYGGCSSPTKYDLNGTMPATLNSTVGSCGIRLAEGTGVWPFAAKKPRKESRSSSALIDFIVPREGLAVEPVLVISRSSLPTRSRSVQRAFQAERRTHRIGCTYGLRHEQRRLRPSRHDHVDGANSTGCEDCLAIGSHGSICADAPSADTSAAVTARRTATRRPISVPSGIRSSRASSPARNGCGATSTSSAFEFDTDVPSPAHP